MASGRSESPLEGMARRSEAHVSRDPFPRSGAPIPRDVWREPHFTVT